jgi:hypothetical protein
MSAIRRRMMLALVPAGITDASAGAGVERTMTLVAVAVLPLLRSRRKTLEIHHTLFFHYLHRKSLFSPLFSVVRWSKVRVAFLRHWRHWKLRLHLCLSFFALDINFCPFFSCGASFMKGSSSFSSLLAEDSDCLLYQSDFQC